MIWNRAVRHAFNYFCLWLGLSFVLCGSATSQTTSSSPQTPTSASVSTLSVDARLVNLPVVVHDKKGALVRNLTKDDFTLQVDGRPQTIRYFDIDTNLPLTL